jgi:PAS domain S-box-containing protein
MNLSKLMRNIPAMYANDICLLADDKLKVVEANDRAAASFGYPRDELLRLNLSDLQAPAAAGELSVQIEKARRRGGHRYQTACRRKDGTVFPAEVSARPIEIEGKHYIQEIVVDITAPKRAEEGLHEAHLKLQACYRRLVAKNQKLLAKNKELTATEEGLRASEEELRAAEEELRQQNEELQRERTELASSEARYRRLFEMAQESIVIVNAETGMIEDANPFIKIMLGYPREELIGQKLWDIGLVKDIVASHNSFDELRKKGYISWPERDTSFINSPRE